MISRGELYKALETVVDPELMIGILDLGLVYRLEITDDVVEIDYTLTYPGCPAGELIEADIRNQLLQVEGVKGVEANVIWDPPWRPDYMTEEAKLSLGYPI